MLGSSSITVGLEWEREGEVKVEREISSGCGWEEEKGKERRGGRGRTGICALLYLSGQKEKSVKSRKNNKSDHNIHTLEMHSP